MRGRKSREEEFDREVRAHLELEEEERREAGQVAAEARYAARRAFGNVTLYKEVMREMWGWASIERLGQDLRYAIRMMGKHPGFTLVAVLSLALGIGGNTAIFSLMNAVMLRSLPVREPDRLVLFGKGTWSGIVDSLPEGKWQLFSYPFYRDVQRNSEVFAGVAAQMSLPNDVRATVAGGGEAEPVHARLVSGTYFDTLGVKAAVGRTLSDADDQVPGGHPVAVIGYSWWERRFARDPSAVGRTVAIGGTEFTIVGVAAREFFGTTVGESADLWIPLAMNAQVPPAWGGPKAIRDPLFQSLYIVARLKPGIGMGQAEARVNLLFKQNLRAIAGTNPSEKDLNAIRRAGIDLTPAGRGLSRVRHQFSGSLQLLMGAVGLVLLIACANIANLLLARAASRQREIAIRLSVGASRVRLIRQMLTESVLLAGLGGAAGVAFAAWASRLLVRMVSAGGEVLPLRVAPDLPVLLFTTLLAGATGIVCGLAPALRATRVNLNVTLKDARTSGLARSRNSLAKGLIVSQVALSVVLLIGAGLFLRSLVNLRNVDTGFERQGVLVASVDTASLGYKNDDSRLTAVYRQVEQEVERTPGVQAASFALFTFQMGAWTGGFFPQKPVTLPENQREVHNNSVGPEYFAAMGLPVKLGRAFSAADTPKSPKVAIVNETLAHLFFPGVSPVGQRYGFSAEHPAEIEIVGVVKDAKYESLRETPTPMAFYPDAQQVRFQGNLVVRYQAQRGAPFCAAIEERNSAVSKAARDAPFCASFSKASERDIAAALRAAVARVNARLPITEVRTMRDQVDSSLVEEKLMARLSGFFGLLALLLASIGIYGVLAYTVARRTSEVGLRMALGAQRSNVVWLVLRDVLALLGLGMAIGIPSAIAAQRLVAGFLYGVAAVDAVAVVTAAAILGLVALLAAYLPARRASLVDPTIALRYE